MQYQTLQRTNCPSILLTKEENDFVFSLLAPRCVSMSTAVVQLFSTMRPANSAWMKQLSGVACFVRDSSKRSYFIRVYCMKNHVLVWEEEMYRSIEIFQPRKFLITFEGQNCMVALNFSDEREAQNFYDTVSMTCMNRPRKERPNQNPHTDNDYLSQAQSQPPKLPPPNQNKDKKKNQSDAKRPLFSKDDISWPQDMKHIAHVGLNDPMSKEKQNAWNAYLEQIGIPEKELRDNETRELLYGVIENHQIQNAKSSQYYNQNIQIDIKSRPNEKQISVGQYLTPPPSIPAPRTPQQQIRSLSPSKSLGVPPPPPIATLPKNSRKKMQQENCGSWENQSNNSFSHNTSPSAAPSQPISTAVRQPPPPPPSLAMGLVPAAPPAPPPMAPLEIAAPMPSVNVAVQNEQRPAQVVVSCARVDLLEDIRKGIQLKKPQKSRENIEPIQNISPSNDLTAALWKALAKRKEAIQSSDDEDQPSEENSDNEWDD